MGIKCKLLGHAYTEEDTEQKEQTENNNKLLVDYSIKVCKRCGNRKEEKIRTQIRNEEDTDNEQEESEDSEVRSKYKSSEPTDTSTSTGMSEPKTSNAQGGVVLKSSSLDNNDSETNVVDNPDTEIIEDEGAIVYDKREKDGVRKRVSCESCDYSEITVVSSRRNGDLCTECGGWLNVERVDNETSDEDSDE